ncbi:MAG: bifunctional precorrin-2 dehydrogenase/sirohydrochlorin ferrochelatase [Thermodesulfobacteriota bacterium]
MRYYPIFLDIKGKACLVVGGGDVGSRKVKTLLECGACVTVISPEVIKPIQDLAETHIIQWKSHCYNTGDLDGFFLVIGATNDEAINFRISRDALERGMLCNIADRPDACNFILPSLVRRGDLTIAISTSGKSPALAKRLRKELEAHFGSEYSDVLRLMGAIRNNLLSQRHAPEAHKPLFEALLDRGIVDLMRQKEFDKVNDLLKDLLGKEYELQSLMKSDN